MVWKPDARLGERAGFNWLEDLIKKINYIQICPLNFFRKKNHLQIFKPNKNWIL